MSKRKLHTVRIGNRRIAVPSSPLLRQFMGGTLVVMGCLGFLPILGFWMIPLGLLVLSVDVPAIRRLRRRTEVWWHKRRRKKDPRKI